MTRPLYVISFGQFEFARGYLCLYDLVGIFNHADLITFPRIKRNIPDHESILTLDHGRAYCIFNITYLCNRDLRTGRSRDEYLRQHLEIIPDLSHIPGPYRITFTALNSPRNILTANGHLYDILNITQIHPVPCNCFTVYLKLNIWFTNYAIGYHVNCSRYLFYYRFQLQAYSFNLLQVSAKYLCPHHCTQAGLEHDHPCLYRLKPRGCNAGHIRSLTQLLKNLILCDSSLL